MYVLAKTVGFDTRFSRVLSLHVQSTRVQYLYVLAKTVGFVARFSRVVFACAVYTCVVFVCIGKDCGILCMFFPQLSEHRCPSRCAVQKTAYI